jgi:hypothetical protein
MTEQPYFMVKVTKCGECPQLHYNHARDQHCSAVSIDSPLQIARRYEVVQENFDGITPSCPMWVQRVQPEPPKD